MTPADFGALMNRFYDVATRVLVDSNAFLDKFVGDEVIGIYLPAFAGQDHALSAVTAARGLLVATGHDDPDGPWIPVGVGVHSGPAYFGTVKGSQGSLTDLTALGDTVNVAARLAQNAGVGEALVSEAAAEKAPSARDLPKRNVRLKGKSQPIAVRVIATKAQRPRRSPRSPAKPATRRKR